MVEILSLASVSVWCVWLAWQMINIACLVIFFYLIHHEGAHAIASLCLPHGKMPGKNRTMKTLNWVNVWMSRTSMNFRRLRVNMNYLNFEVFTWMYFRHHRSAHFCFRNHYHLISHDMNNNRCSYGQAWNIRIKAKSLFVNVMRSGVSKLEHSLYRTVSLDFRLVFWLIPFNRMPHRWFVFNGNHSSFIYISRNHKMVQVYSSSAACTI